MKQFSELMRFFDNFVYYRRAGHSVRGAWRLAGLTLPF